MTKKQKLKSLRILVSLCFQMLEGWSDEEIADAMGCHRITVYRLRTGRFTLAVRFGTIQALGLAAGFEVKLTDKDYELKLAA